MEKKEFAIFGQKSNSSKKIQLSMSSEFYIIKESLKTYKSIHEPTGLRVFIDAAIDTYTYGNLVHSRR